MAQRDRVTVHEEDGTTWVRLDRAHVRNALDNEALVELRSALDNAVHRGSRALILYGSGRTFCAGSDIKALRANDAEYQRLHTEAGQRLFDEIERAPLLTIAAVEGYCLGGGVELTLACDVRLSVADAVWGFPEVRLGAIPAWGGTQRLPRFVGLGHAKRLLLTGERLTATQLVATGLIDEVLPSWEDVLARAQSIALGARDNTLGVFADIKSLVLASLETPLHVGSLMERLCDARVAGSIADHQRGGT
jgi:enoyl-CoA hydratase/carnithine racemase